MKEVRLKKLRLLNFKGIRNKEISFEGGQTSILADNGVGKSTVQDAFTWLFYGKDRKGRKASGKSSFGIRTYDENGNIIPRIPHEVCAEIEVDGNIINLRRTFSEKWVKSAGEIEPHYDGNEEERFFNDVPCSTKDWDEKISLICPEEIFRLITSPGYFPSLKMEEKRKQLIQMAGGVSDEEIAQGNEAFTALLATLRSGNKSLEEYRKEIVAKKNKVKNEIDKIPERIDEKQRDMPEPENWDEIDAAIKQKEAEVESIQDRMMNEAKRNEDENNRRLEISERLHEVRSKIQARSHAIKDKAFQSHREYQEKRNALIDERKSLASQIERLTNQIPSLEADKERAIKSRDKMLAEYKTLKEQSKQIKAEQLQISEDDFKCPTCGRTFEPDQIEAKQTEMLARFEEQRKRELDAKTEEINENIAKGKRNNEYVSSLTAEIYNCRKRIDEAKKRIEEIDNSDALKKSHTPPDATPLIDADAEIKTLREEEARLSAVMEAPAAKQDDETVSNLSERRKALMYEIKDLQKRSYKRETIDSCKRRISELEGELKKLNQELSTLEKAAAKIAAFSKARINAVEDKINSLFKFVKFKLFDTQVNGGEVEICEAMLNGVPYSDCSHAEKINMGLDIINAISRNKGITAPIFIDNAEGVTRLAPTESQVIRLVVSPEHKELTIINQ